MIFCLTSITWRSKAHKIGLCALWDKKKGDVDKKNRQSDTKRHRRSTLCTATGVRERGIQLAQRLTLARCGFSLTETEFRVGFAIRYGWEPKNTPALCPCGEIFNLAHALHCVKDGYSHMKHNKICDTFANLVKDGCFDVELTWTKASSVRRRVLP